jgi:hypothetical protein
VWEQLKRIDADSLHNAACFRSATAAIIRARDPTPGGAPLAREEADKAMRWLKQAGVSRGVQRTTSQPGEADS